MQETQNTHTCRMSSLASMGHSKYWTILVHFPCTYMLHVSVSIFEQNCLFIKYIKKNKTSLFYPKQKFKVNVQYFMKKLHLKQHWIYWCWTTTVYVCYEDCERKEREGGGGILHRQISSSTLNHWMSARRNNSLSLQKKQGANEIKSF